MTGIDSLTTALKSRLCTALDVSSVPVGYAISTGFIMPDGDPLTFYAIEGDDGWILQDDGATLPEAIAMGIDISAGHREHLLNGILGQEGARFDPKDLLIFTDPVEPDQLGRAAVSFVSALIRMQDLSLLSVENTKVNFVEDVKTGILPHLPSEMLLKEREPRGAAQPDMTIRDEQTNLMLVRLYAANADLRIFEALFDNIESPKEDSPVVAIVD